MEEKTAFGNFIVKKRKECGLTQRELAERLFVTESAVSKWERGLSYPDITLVGDLCKVLGVTEHELITASEDLRQKEMERHAQRYERIVKGYIGSIHILLGIAVIACFIVNLVLSHGLNWFFVVIAALMVAYSLLVLPVMIEKNQGLIVLGGFYVSLNLLLACCRLLYGGTWFTVTFVSVLFGFVAVFLPYVLRKISLPDGLYRHRALFVMAVDTLLLVLTVGAASMRNVTVMGGGLPGFSVFWTVALPVTLVAVSLPWILLVVIRYIRINGFFKASLCLMACGAYLGLLNSVIAMFVDGVPFRLPAVNLRDWSLPYINGNIYLVCALVCFGMAMVFAFAGIWTEMRKHR